MPESSVAPIYFETYATGIFDEIKDRFQKAHSEMSEAERYFLNGIVRYFKPKKILEIGVSAGASSVIILNAIKDIHEAKLYSVDLSRQYYKAKDKPTGFVVNNSFPDLAALNKWDLKTGGLVYKFIDEIKDGIDLCFIDTTHSRPGEILDYLMVLPYLSPACVVVIHDTAYHMFLDKPPGGPCGLLFSVIRGEKYSLTKSGDNWVLPNIGAVVCDGSNRTDAISVFNLLSLRWEQQTFTPESIQDIRAFFSRHYSERELCWFDMSYENQIKQAQHKIQKEQKEQAKIQKEQIAISQEIKYPLSKKIKAYALFPWYLYRSLHKQK